MCVCVCVNYLLLTRVQGDRLISIKNIETKNPGHFPSTHQDGFMREHSTNQNQYYKQKKMCVHYLNTMFDFLRFHQIYHEWSGLAKHCLLYKSLTCSRLRCMSSCFVMCHLVVKISHAFL